MAARRVKSGESTKAILIRLESHLLQIETELRQIKDQLGAAKSVEKLWWECPMEVFKDEQMYNDYIKELRKNRRADYAAARAEASKDARKKRRSPTSSPK